MATVSMKLAYTMRESGQLTGFCERVIWQAVKDGDLRAVRLGRSVRILHVELVPHVVVDPPSKREFRLFHI